MITITPELTITAFNPSTIHYGFEQALNKRKKLNANKKTDLILIHTITNEYKIYEYTQLQRITPCGISFTNIPDENVENYIDYTLIRTIQILRFKKKF